jgi:hypothetical protein
MTTASSGLPLGNMTLASVATLLPLEHRSHAHTVVSGSRKRTSVRMRTAQARGDGEVHPVASETEKTPNGIPSAGGNCTPQVVRAPLGATLPTKQTLQTLKTLSRGHPQHQNFLRECTRILLFYCMEGLPTTTIST